MGAKAGYDAWRSRLPQPQWAGDNPYPGLSAYHEDRSAVFFGRRREVRDLVDRVRDARAVNRRFIPVLGPSGSGKSSLVFAGVLPVLRNNDEWTVLPPMTPGGAPLEELRRVLGTEDLSRAAAALTARRTAKRVLMIVDQLEELVTLAGDDVRDSFVGLLDNLLQQEPRLRVIATVRSEWIGRFQERAGNDLFEEPFMVNVMGPEQLREVHVGALSAEGRRVAMLPTDSRLRD